MKRSRATGFIFWSISLWVLCCPFQPQFTCSRGHQPQVTSMRARWDPKSLILRISSNS
jgi:hypothetical protein